MKHSFVILGIAGLLLQACAGTKNENKTSANGYQTIDVTALDRTIKPADDFFTFANGTWVAKTEIPASESRWGSFNELEQQNNIKLKAILNEAVANPGALVLSYGSFASAAQRSHCMFRQWDRVDS